MFSYNDLYVVYSFLTVFAFLSYLLKRWFHKSMIEVRKQEERKMKDDRSM